MIRRPNNNIYRTVVVVWLSLSIASVILADHCCELGRQPPEFSPAAVACLQEYHWPGNVRELGNEMKRLAIVVRRDCLDVDVLAEPIGRSTGFRGDSENSGALSEAVESVERRMILAALEKCKSNQQQAARLLGLSRQGLLNKIKRYAIAVRAP